MQLIPIYSFTPYFCYSHFNAVSYISGSPQVFTQDIVENNLLAIRAACSALLLQVFLTFWRRNYFFKF